ncbi:hypothetical protein [Clavibacter michiganensis]|uniref:hypothetical protein n=1 Tax=Clavibacter michiganensis TaxID=28447 RepID=UPI00292F4D98|nr:hypothetical protein [Clavibacter michiganensis]
MLVVVLIATLLAIFAPVTDGDDATGPAPLPTAAPTPSTAEVAGPCSVAASDASSTPSMPADLTWKTGADGVTWPVSKSVGPTKSIDGFDACFARTPLGVALAAQTAIYSQYDTAHSAADSLSHYIIDSPGKAAAIAGTVKSSSPEQLRTSGMNPAGFTIDRFTADRADVTLVFSLPATGTGYVGIPCSLQWVNDDWKLSVLDNGQLTSGTPTTPSKGDFVSWRRD